MQWAVEHLAERSDHLLLGERMRPGQVQPRAGGDVAQERAGGDGGDVAFVDRRRRGLGVGAVHDVAPADRGPPQAQRVGGEHARAQDDAVQPGGDGGVLGLPVAVTAVAGGLPHEVVLDVDRRQDHHLLHPVLSGEREQFRRGAGDGTGVEEDRRDALERIDDRLGPCRVAGDDVDAGGQPCGVRAAADGPDRGARAVEQIDEDAADVAGRSGHQDHGRSSVVASARTIGLAGQDGAPSRIVTAQICHFSASCLVLDW